MQLIGTKEAATLLGLQPSTIRKQVKEGRLKATKVGRDWMIDKDDLIISLAKKNHKELEANN